MTWRQRWLRNGAIGAAALMLLVVLAAVIILPSRWFADWARGEVIAAVDDATGGKSQIASLRFLWPRVGVIATGFVLRGTEAASEAPLAAVQRLELRIRLFPSWGKLFAVQFAAIDRPVIHLIAYPDGRTNLPEPKHRKPPSGNNADTLEQVVNLAVQRFEINDGLAAFDGRKARFSARGENLRALVVYDTSRPGYQGELSIDPLLLQSDGHRRLPVRLRLPLQLDRNTIRLAGGSIATPESRIGVNASVSNLAAPVIAAQLDARLSLVELGRTVTLPLRPEAPGAPRELVAKAAMHLDDTSLIVDNAALDLGGTRLRAAGPLRSANGQGALRFDGQLVLAELTRLLHSQVAAQGLVMLAGTARLTGQSDYLVDGQIATARASVRTGTAEVKDFSLKAGVHADPHVVDVRNLLLSVLGGQLTADGRLRDGQFLAVDGRLSHLDLQTVTAALTRERLAYAGVISGPLHVRDDFRAEGTKGLAAEVGLSIAQGRNGVPIAGRLQANYRGLDDTIALGNSFVSLPHSRLNLTGTLGRQLELTFQSRNLHDLLPAVNFGAKRPMRELPVTILQNGSARALARVRGSLNNPQITGRVEADRFAVEQRPFDRFGFDVTASPLGAAVSNGELSHRSLRAGFDASVRMREWKMGPHEPVTAKAVIHDAEMADLLQLAGQQQAEVRGTLNLDAHVNGTVGNPLGNANLSVVHGAAYGEPFDHVTAQLALVDQQAILKALQVVAGPAQLDAHGTFTHPRSSFATGNLELALATNDFSIEEFKTVQRRRPATKGRVHLDATLSGALRQKGTASEFAASNVNANLSVRDLGDKELPGGNLLATARTVGSRVNYDLNSSLLRANVKLNGVTELAPNYPTKADLSISGLKVERILGMIDQPPVVKGTLGATAQVAGTLAEPRATATLRLAQADVYGEPVENLATTINYTATSIEVPSISVEHRAGRIDMRAALTHPAGDLRNGHVQGEISSSPLDLGRIQTVQAAKPSFGGTVQLAVQMAADLRNSASGQQVRVSLLNSNVGATDLVYNKQQWGNARFVAQTQQSAVHFQMDSDFAKTAIHGSGVVRLRPDYPVNAELNFANIRYANLQPFLSESVHERPGFDGLVEGRITVDGPAADLDQLRAALRLQKVQLIAAERGPGATPGSQFVALQNEEPIAIDLDRSLVNVRSFHLTGRNTDINVGGRVALHDQRPLNLSVKANTNLALLEQIDRQVYSSGNVDLNAAVHGTFGDPAVSGQLALRNASLNLADAPVGLSNANGLVLLNGTSATIQNLSGEMGGGRISATGFAGFVGRTLRYSLASTASNVRVRQSGVSVSSDANLKLNGNSQRGLLSGLITVRRVAYSSSSDFGSILSQAGTPVETPSAPSGLLAGLRLDVRIRTAPDVKFVTEYAQHLAADADLTLRGTALQPGLLGRLIVTQGQLVFFNNTYTVNQGNVTFFNPIKIEPVLDVSLETQTQGVDVVLNVSGPVDNLKLTYRSDPPLQFQEIVTLLATGRTPTSDPTILANQPAPPQQSLGQLGASALVGQAVANPLASRVQRVFGINSLKVDPTFTSGSALPQARVSLQQQVTPALTFTYTSDLTATNSQIIRVEYAFSSHYSVVATRDENGYFGLDFFVKKQFR